jgi:hypothetical protein
VHLCQKMPLIITQYWMKIHQTASEQLFSGRIHYVLLYISNLHKSLIGSQPKVQVRFWSKRVFYLGGWPDKRGPTIYQPPKNSDIVLNFGKLVLGHQANNLRGHNHGMHACCSSAIESSLRQNVHQKSHKL